MKNFFKIGTGFFCLAIVVILVVGTLKNKSGNDDAATEETATVAQATETTETNEVEETEESFEMEDLAAPAEEVEGEADHTLAAAVKRATLSDEDEAIQAEYGEDAYSAAVTTLADAGMELEDASVEHVFKEDRDRWEALISEELRDKFLVVDHKGEETHVLTLAREMGYADHNISTALEPAFTGDTGRTDEVGLWVASLASDPSWLDMAMRLDGNLDLKTGDKDRPSVKFREVKGNTFFNAWILENRKAYARSKDEFEKMMSEDEILEGEYKIEQVSFDGGATFVKPVYENIPGEGGDGIDHWLVWAGTDKDGHDVFHLSEDYLAYAKNWYCWFMNTMQYYGAKEWNTRIKSVMDDRDPTNNGTYARVEFTDLVRRQTNLTSLVWAMPDKNGNRLTEFWGINRCDANGELYATGTTKKGSGGQTVVDYSLPSGGSTSAAAVSTGTAVTYSATKKTSDPTPTKTPSNPTTSKKKDKSKSSVNNPANSDNQATVGTDEFQKNYPLTAEQIVEWVAALDTSNPVQYSQGGNTSDYTQAIESGAYIPSGSEDHISSSPGSSSTSGDVTTVTGQTDSGVTYQDTYEPDTSAGASDGDTHYTDNESVDSSPIEHQDNPDNDGDSSSNDSMPTNSDSGNGDENFF